jgi:3-oxoacyl-[acyl-carrier protein] reductase
MSEPAINSLLDLTGQVALITGASRGIGRSTAELFAQAGARVVLLARSAAPLEQAAEALRQVYGAERVMSIIADVAQVAQVDAAVQQVSDAWGRVDVLVNNAGLIHSGSLEAVTPGDWERVIGAN